MYISEVAAWYKRHSLYMPLLVSGILERFPHDFVGGCKTGQDLSLVGGEITHLLVCVIMNRFLHVVVWGRKKG